MKTKKTIVYVRWFDSTITQGETVSMEDVGEVSELESAGILLKDGARSITIGLDRSLTTGNLRCTLCIPRENIRSIKTFQVTVSD